MLQHSACALEKAYLITTVDRTEIADYSKAEKLLKEPVRLA